MKYPQRRSVRRYLWEFLIVAAAFVAFLVSDIFDIPAKIWSPLAGIIPKWEVQVNLFPLILFFLGLVIAGIVVMKDMLEERDAYFNIVEEHYGKKAVIRRLIELRREGKRIADEAPRTMTVRTADPATVPNWAARYRAWVDETTHVIKDLCSKDAATQFLAIDKSHLADTNRSSIRDVRGILGKMDQYLSNIDTIVRRLNEQPAVEGTSEGG